MSQHEKRSVWRVGDRVRAVLSITAPLGSAEDVEHAVPGDEGIVVHAQHDTYPTVKFDRTGLATIVDHDEIEAVQ